MSDCHSHADGWECRSHRLDGEKAKKARSGKALAVKQILRSRPEGLTPENILKHAFGLKNVPREIAGTIVSDILGGEGFYSVDNDIWTLDGSECTSLDVVPFMVVDLETTGGRPATNRVIEIGGFKIVAGQIVSSIMALINPGRRIPLMISRLTGIYDEHVADSPRADEILPAFLRFMEDGVFVGHNARFDFSFMNAELARYGHPPLENEVVCTIKLTRRIFPGEPSYSLDNFIKKFDLEIDPVERHRGHGDAWATAELLLRCLQKLREAGINNLEELLRFQAMPAAKARKKYGFA